MTKKTTYLYKALTALCLVAASQFITTNASANPQIFSNAMSKGVKVTGCQSCHAGSPGQESRSDLKTNYYNAYILDTSGLSRLKNLINGCPAGQTLDPKTFLCTTAAVPPKTVTGSVGLSTSGIARTDVYNVTCGTGTSYLAVSVSDLAPVKAPIVSIQATKGTASSPLSQDSKDGDGVFSPEVKLAKGKGIYNMKVNKSASSVNGVETYTAQFACKTAAGVQTATTAVLKQNQ
ncbi:MAG: hypothetical protein PHR16_00250 [Methylovulum sp.]|nr:hypothetical protein [Methylovulum sp.]